jgi:hypothetical protein
MTLSDEIRRRIAAGEKPVDLRIELDDASLLLQTLAHLSPMERIAAIKLKDVEDVETPQKEERNDY